MELWQQWKPCVGTNISFICGIYNKQRFQRFSNNSTQTCSQGDLFTNTLYLWSNNGSSYQLPDNVGFPVGGDTRTQYLVLQVHYLIVDLVTVPDTTGVDMMYTDQEPDMSAGVLSVHVNTNVPAYSRTYQDGGCTIGEDKILYPLSYFVHTHRLGEVICFFTFHLWIATAIQM